VLFRFNTHRSQQFFCFSLRIRFGYAIQFHRETDVLQHCQQWKQVKSLKNHGYPFTTVLIQVHIGKLFPIQEDSSFCGLIQPGHQREEGRLTAAGRANNRAYFSTAKHTGHMIYYFTVAIFICVTNSIQF
jgi:hypothetical protein